MGTVWRIHIAAERGTPAWEVDRISAEAGLGLRGDRHHGHAPHLGDISMIEGEVLDRLAAEKDIDLRDGGTRRNVITRDIDLGLLVGRKFRVGDVICEGLERCHPCKHVAEMTSLHVLRYLVDTGLRGRILRSGTIQVGDVVELIEEGELVEELAAVSDRSA
jgi:MOSC domain-containing protein YiiM